jgi:ABC-type oligopeptide transport system substrate-binding subunit/transcriptional regulator with XRE-family HTH domain
VEDSSSFGYQLRRRRKALDLTQDQLARLASCALDTIKKIETDARRPSRQLAERLADCLGVQTDERMTFLGAARAERNPDRLVLPTRPVEAAADVPVDPAFLVRASRNDDRAGTIFIGRERELAELERQLAAALAGNGRVAFVTGEAGDGKTALLATFARRAQSTHAGLIVASGNCNAFVGFGDPYLPFRDVLALLTGDIEARQSAGMLTYEQARRLWSNWQHSVQALLDDGPDLIDVFVSGTALARRAAAHAASETSWRARLHKLVARQRGASGRREQRQIFEQYTEVLRAIAAHRPLLILLDDLQWADAASINLLFHLGRRLASSPILILGAYRLSEVVLGRVTTDSTNRAHPLKPVVTELTHHFGHSPIDLGSTTAAEGRRFVDALLDSEPNRLAEQFRAALFGRTRGQPLFTVELLHAMRERGDVVRDADGRWIAGPALAWDALPSRVEAAIKQRIDRLGDTLRDILTVASVEGEEFTAEVLAQAQATTDRELLRTLSQELVQRHGMVRERGEIAVGERHLSRYQFGHVLFQRYLYDRLMPGERRHLHRMVAETLEELYAGHTNEIVVQLAHHYAEAGAREQAISYLFQAGDKARAVYALKEAAEHYQRALAFLRAHGDHERVARTLMKLGLTYHLDFDFERSHQVYAEGFALWQRVRQAQPAAALPPAPHAFRLVWQDPASLDPTMGGHNLQAPILMQLFSGLVAHSPEMEVVPDVAQRWEVLDAGHTYIFQLRDDVYWSDGMPVTAADFEFTFKRALEPATGAPVAGTLLYGIRGARAFHQGQVRDASQVGVYARDDTTLVIELDEPAIYFLNDLAYYVLLPVPRHVVEAHGAAWAEPERIVTNGPFRLAEWRRGESMILVRNPAYHGQFTGNVERVELALGADLATHFALYDADRLDLVHNWFFASAEIDRLRQRHPSDYTSRPRYATIYLCFDITHPPFDDARVRRAFAMAAERTMPAELLYKGYEVAGTGGFVPVGMPGYSAGIGLPYDPVCAQQLLAATGSSPSPDLSAITLLTNHSRQSMAEHLQAQWREHLGVETILKLASPGAILEEIARSRPQIALGGWSADYPDPDNFLRVCVRLDAPEWRHETYDQLLEQARQTTDQAERMSIYQQADRILIEEAIIVPLLYGQHHILLKPWIKQFRIPAIKHPGFWKDVIIDPHL